MLVLVDILLQSEKLFLQLVPQAGQRVSDVIGQLLVQNSLQVGRSEPIGQVPV